MKRYTIFGILGLLLTVSCNSDNNKEEGTHSDEGNHQEQSITLTQEQIDQLGITIKAMGSRDLQNIVNATGQLEVPPQNEASVTAVYGANVFDIQVIEGDMIKQGEILAYFSHPDLVKIQSEYQVVNAELEFLEKELQRSQKLNEEGYSAGKELEAITSKFKAKKGQKEGLKAQLELLKINPKKVAQGKIFKKIPVLAPISGSIKKVEVKTGQFVKAEQEMFSIVNNEHIHADLMVYEKDVTKIQEGQKVRFTVGALPDEELTATIYAIGKTFESEPKAVHVHADIKNLNGKLLPGMYVKGQIITDSVNTMALPDEAIVKEGDEYMIFRATPSDHGFSFVPVPVYPGTTSSGWTAVTIKEDMENHTHDHDNDQHDHHHENAAQYAWDNAYILLSEMKKGSGGHHHH